MRVARVVKVTLIVGVVMLLAVCAYTLSRSPPRVLRAGPEPSGVLTGFDGTGAACQAEEVLPAGTSAIRLSLAAYFGAWVKVTVSSGSLVLAEGRRNPDWTGTSVTVPVRPLSYSTSHVKVCFEVSPNNQSIYLFGRETGLGEGMTLPTGGHLPGRLDIEYLGPGRGSWWSRVGTVAEHMGFGRFFSGTWIALLIAAMVAAVGALAVRVTLRELS